MNPNASLLSTRIEHGPLPGSLRDSMKDTDLSLVKASLRVVFPPGTTLLDDDMNTIQVPDGTSVWISMTSDGIQINCQPAILIHTKRAKIAHVVRNVDGLVENILLEAVSYSFVHQKTDLRFKRVAAWDKYDPSEQFSHQIKQKIAALLAGTPLARSGYDPQNDPDVGATLDAVARNLAKNSKPTRSKFYSVIADATRAEITLRARREIVQRDGDSAVRLPAGAQLTLGSGLLNSNEDARAWLLNWRNKATPRLTSLEVSCPGGLYIQLQDPNSGRLRDAVRITRAQLHRGARLDIDEFQILQLPGKQGDAAQGEKGIEQLGAAVALGGLALLELLAGGVPGKAIANPHSPFGRHVASRALQGAASVKNPMIIGGLTRNELERRLSAKLGSLLGAVLGALLAENYEAVTSMFPSFSFQDFSWFLISP